MRPKTTPGRVVTFSGRWLKFRKGQVDFLFCPGTLLWWRGVVEEMTGSIKMSSTDCILLRKAFILDASSYRHAHHPLLNVEQMPHPGWRVSVLAGKCIIPTFIIFPALYCNRTILRQQQDRHTHLGVSNQ